MKHSKALVAGALSLFALLTNSRGATIAWAAAIDNGLVLQDTTTMLPTGDLIRIGVFSISDASIQSLLSAGNFSAVNAAFTTLGSVAAGGGFGNNPGYFSLSSNTPAPIDSNPGDLNIAGQQLYIWAMNVTSVGNAGPGTQNGIFYMPKSVNSNWAVPSDSPVTGSTSVELSDLTGTDPSQLLGSAVIVEGAFSPNPVASSIRKDANFALAAAPEPASAGLAILGGAAMLLHRRRRSA